MKPSKITFDRLSEEQMQKVREYLAQMPNAPHKGREGEHYGEYIQVTADVRAAVIRATAEMSTDLWYENVTFEVQTSGVKCEYTAKRKAERNEVAKGLTSLIVGFLAEQ